MKTKIICLFNFSLPDILINKYLDILSNHFINFEFVHLKWDTIFNDELIGLNHYQIVNKFFDQIKEINNNEEFIFLGSGYGAKILLDLKHRFKVKKQIYHGLFMSLNYIDPFQYKNPTYKYDDLSLKNRLAKELLNPNDHISFDDYKTWILKNQNYIEVILYNFCIYDTLVSWKKYEPIQLIKDDISLSFGKLDLLVSYKYSIKYINNLNANGLSLNDIYTYINNKHWILIENIESYIEYLKTRLV